jgi:hypothetical protein
MQTDDDRDNRQQEIFASRPSQKQNRQEDQNDFKQDRQIVGRSVESEWMLRPHLRCEDKELLDEFRAYTSTDQNSNRVGEFAIGTNTACTQVIGNILQDEKIPGIHIAFGHPYSEHTGADWKSKTHIDCVGRDFDIWFDGEQVMRAGKFVV